MGPKAACWLPATKCGSAELKQHLVIVPIARTSSPLQLPCDLRAMPIWSALSRLLTVLAVVGFVTGVFAGPGAAGNVHEMATSIGIADGQMPPCEQQQSPSDCGDMAACPFATVCLAKCPQNIPTAASIARRLPLIMAALPHNDEQVVSLALLPLRHPPKA